MPQSRNTAFPRHQKKKRWQQIITKISLFKYTENFTTKIWIFSNKNSNVIHTSAQNIDCGYSLEPPRRGGSNKYPQSKFLGRNKKNNVYPCKPQFYYIKLGLKGVNMFRHVFVMNDKTNAIYQTIDEQRKKNRNIWAALKR